MKHIIILLCPLLLFIVTACYEKPQKPFIITEEQFNYVGFAERPLYTYVFIGKNGTKGEFSRPTDDYNVGDTIK